MKVVAPAAARNKVQKLVPVDATEVDFGDPTVRFVTVAGTGEREGALIVTAGTGTTLVINDIIFNLTDKPGFGGWIMKTIGMTGEEPRIPPPVRMREVKDKNALRVQFEEWARIPDLKRVIISHGNIIGAEAPEVLSRIAQELAA